MNATTDQGQTALDKLRDATRMLGEVRTSREAKALMDKAAAAQFYAQKAKLGEQAITYAHTILIEAMALLGGFLKTAPKRGTEHSRGGGSKGSTRAPLPDAPPTLADLGLTKKESMQAQRLYDIKAKAPAEFAAVRERKKTIARAYRVVVVDPPAAEKPKWDFAAGSDRLRRAVDREVALAGEKELPRIVYALRQIIKEVGGRDL